jgi:hypothetical protein
MNRSGQFIHDERSQWSFSGKMEVLPMFKTKIGIALLSGIAMVTGLFVMTAVPASAAAPPPTVCDQGFSGLPAGIYRDVVVPPGAFCQLQGTGAIVTNNVVVEEGAEYWGLGNIVLHDVIGHKPLDIKVMYGASVGHDVRVNGATRYVYIGETDGNGRPTTIGHDVEITNSKGLDAFAAIGIGSATIVGNDVTVDHNTGDYVNVDAAHIGRNLLVTRNYPWSSTDVSDNFVGNNLKVRDNIGPVTVSNNTVGGTSKIQ